MSNAIQPIYSGITTDGWGDASSSRYVEDANLEQLRALQEQANAANAANDEAQRTIEEKTIAAHRAKELFLEHLTERQRKTFEERNWFVIEGGKSKRAYRIRTDTVTANVDIIIEGGRVVDRLCCHCDYSIPFFDHLTTQKIFLESEEEEVFLKKANSHGAYTPGHAERCHIQEEIEHLKRAA